MCEQHEPTDGQDALEDLEHPSVHVVSPVSSLTVLTGPNTYQADFGPMS